MRTTLRETSPSTRAGDLKSPSQTHRNATGRRLQVAGTCAIVLLAAALLCAPPAFAQVKTEPTPPKPAAPAAVPAPPKPPVPPAVPSSPEKQTASPVPPLPAPAKAAVPARPASESRKLSLLETPACPLEGAVLHLQRALEASNMEPLNILFGPDTKDLEVASLNLRNISGEDALHLIAAAANCTVETMTTKEAQGITVGYSPAENTVYAYPMRVIGYMFRAKPKQVMALPGMPGPMMLPAGRPAPATSQTGRLTRIYPLGAVSTATKFPDLEKTLREIFKADGVTEHQVSLALHEKTNVLVVNAAEPVHALVEQLLTALKDNTNQADRQNTARDRATGREELESALRGKARLEQEVAERDAQMRELQKELRKLQDATQKPPSAK